MFNLKSNPFSDDSTSRRLARIESGISSLIVDMTALQACVDLLAALTQPPAGARPKRVYKPRAPKVAPAPPSGPELPAGLLPPADY